MIAQRLVRKKANHGYQGRTGIFEMLPMSDSLNTLILQQGAQANILKQAKQNGMVSLWEAALKKVNAGITDMAEIYRVVQHHA